MRIAWFAMAALALTAGACGGRERLERKLKASQEAEIPKVPYVVSGSRTGTTVNLWSDSGRTESKPAHKIPSGTKVKILETKEESKSRGGTMCRVRAVTGEEGWIPDKFIEYREK
jgi:hypothetical protein